MSNPIKTLSKTSIQSMIQHNVVFVFVSLFMHNFMIYWKYLELEDFFNYQIKTNLSWSSIISLLFALKLRYHKRIIFLRGNHEMDFMMNARNITVTLKCGYVPVMHLIIYHYLH